MSVMLLNELKARFVWEWKGRGTCGVVPEAGAGPDREVGAWTVSMETDSTARPFESHWPKPVESMVEKRRLI